MSKNNELVCEGCGDNFLPDFKDGVGEMERTLCRTCLSMEDDTEDDYLID